ncbi:class I SAM-dependent methyltransferase [Salinirussus salinus]|jgi:SAM-dependent methyltransferase|uniref:class I SAM-dependent methyltransferase n=1 Tax=Salinirussus salinus TaxID=1198300 RepID=UPI00135852F8|nr:class I SAM-dependent methyltransferase [Salinirussus salinus]
MDRKRVRQAWDDVADTYSRNRDPDGEDAALVAELLEDLPPEPTVLDAGCGDGKRTLARLGDARAVGLDFSRRGLELARRNVPGAALVQGDMVDLPLADGTVDGITAYHAVFHVDRDRHTDVYREFARVLRPGGRVLMTVGTSAYEQVRSGWMGGRMFFSTPGRERTLAQLREAGFELAWDRHVDDPLGSSAYFVCAALPA